MKRANPRLRGGSSSFKRDVILSVTLHVVVIAATVLSSPLTGEKRLNMGEVVRVQLTSASALAASEPLAIKPIQVPAAIEAPPEDIPITSPTTKKQVAVEAKKPEQSKPKKPPTNQSKLANAESTEAANSGPKKIDAEGTGSGSPFAGATIDQPTFDYPYWFTQAFNKIAQNYRVPIAYDGTLVCVVYFQVIRSGRLVETHIERSSGVEAFDNACVMAIERSAPFPPLPREFREEVIGITIPFKSTP